MSRSKLRLAPLCLAGCLASLLASVAAVDARADAWRIDSVVEREDETPEPGRLWIDGRKVRIEFGESESGGPRWVWIYRGDRKLLWAIDPMGGRFAEIEEDALPELGRQLRSARAEIEARLAGMPEAQRALVARMLGPAAEAAPKTLRPDRTEATGREDVFLQVPVEIHDLYAGEQATGELWLCSWKDAGVARRKLRGLRGLAEFQRLLLDQLETGSRLRESAPPFELFDRLPGYPLRLRSEGSETRFARPVEVSLSDDAFEVPAAYTPASAAEVLRGAKPTARPTSTQSSGGS